MTTARTESRSPPRNHASRAIISRIAAPFSPRPRYITDLTINTTDPHRIYAPGDAVRGDVKFTAHKAIKLTHLVVQLHGFVKIYKNATPPGEGIPTEASAVGSVQGFRGGRSRTIGYVKIFEEEQVLCGQGGLGPGRYQVPFNVRFPASPLPSSLDFERGTISYVLSTVLTRPTTVVPTMAHERKIYLRETVDVSRMNTPKQRAISLKPVSRRARGRVPSKVDERPLDPARGIARSMSADSNSQHDGRSPSISEQSARSAFSTTSGLRNVPSMIESERMSLANGEEVRVITASVDILRDGYLPGDTIPVRVMVKHTKPIKAMRGVIVTLYRRGRIDGAMALETTGSSSEMEDYLPKSRTGLGGLFASSNFSHNYRYDLDQNIAPMVINPNTMQGEVKTSVRLPDDIFPTITCVPHGLITFTYHVEVVMDLGGKLSAADRLLPRLSMTRSTTNYELGESHGHSPYNPAGAPRRIFDTMDIRRADSIAHCTFDIVVGTKDSKRKVVKKAADPWIEAQRAFGSATTNTMDELATSDCHDQSHDRLSPTTGSAEEFLLQGSVINPVLANQEEPANEKERLRRHEELVLPSWPPLEGATSSSYSGGPSAPSQSELDLDADADGNTSAYWYPQNTIWPASPEPDGSVDEKDQLRRHEEVLYPGSPSHEVEDGHPSTEHSVMEASAPTPTALGLDTHQDPVYMSGYHNRTPIQGELANPDLAGSARTPISLGKAVDKQERERQRLLTTTSQPNYDEGSADHETATAPSLGEGDEVMPGRQETIAHDRRAAWEGVDGVEHLPEYQR